MNRLRLAALWVCLVLLPPAAFSAQIDRTVENKQPTDCTENGDRRLMICRGAWSGKTVSLFNTWSAPDANPERLLDLPSPDGKKIIQVRGFHVRLSVGGKRFWTPFGNMHDAEVG
jgi:hypothetical protein